MVVALRRPPRGGEAAFCQCFVLNLNSGGASHGKFHATPPTENNIGKVHKIGVHVGHIISGKFRQPGKKDISLYVAFLNSLTVGKLMTASERSNQLVCKLQWLQFVLFCFYAKKYDLPGDICKGLQIKLTILLMPN